MDRRTGSESAPTRRTGTGPGTLEYPCVPEVGGGAPRGAVATSSIRPRVYPEADTPSCPDGPARPQVEPYVIDNERRPVTPDGLLGDGYGVRIALVLRQVRDVVP